MSEITITADASSGIHPVQQVEKYSFAILRHQINNYHEFWIDACENSDRDVRYRVVDLTSHDWLEKILSEGADCLLAYPPESDSIKRLYDERTYILSHGLGRKIYPSFEEMLIYENKRFLSFWLQANQVPHARTWVFYDKQAALDFARSCVVPIVAKTAVGALGTGVEIIKTAKRLEEYIRQAFSTKGIRRRYGPNFRKVNLVGRSLQKLKNLPAYVGDLRDRRNRANSDTQRGFVILQEYIRCDYEWRAVRIGDSYFAHKKLSGWGEMMSGTSRVGWDQPPESLLDFVKHVCDKRAFYSQAVDIFEPAPGNYLVNELQCFFGSHHKHQMVVDGKPGRFVRKDDQWTFEEGEFNAFNSFQLRLKHVMELMDTNQL